MGTLWGQSTRSRKRARQIQSPSSDPMKIHSFLRIEPEIRGCSKRRSQLHRHLSSYGSPLVHDSVDDLDVAPEVISQLLLRHPEGDKELLP